jgi:hypothetical protein
VTAFVGSFVGFLVGFSGLPDKDSPCVTNGLGTVCRVCRVSTGVESPGEIAQDSILRCGTRANLLLGLDLNDVPL